jgi:hypothetical protein
VEVAAAIPGLFGIHGKTGRFVVIVLPVFPFKFYSVSPTYRAMDAAPPENGKIVFRSSSVKRSCNPKK